MGLFDNEKVIVDVLATKLTDTEVTPLKNAIISGVVRNSGVSDGILAGMLNGLGARAHRYYKYANSDKWSGELPEVNVGLIIENVAPYELTPYPGTFYPVATLRKDKAFLTPETEWSLGLHKETKRLMKRVALNIDNIIENIEDTDREDEEGNPIEGNPVEQLDDVFFLFGLDLYSPQEKSAEYMYDFWENTIPVIKQDEETFHAAVLAFQEGGPLGSVSPIPSNLIEFHGTGQHVLHYIFDYVSQETLSGTLLNEEGKKISAKAEVIKENITKYEYTPEEQTSTYYIDNSYVKYSKQIEEGVIGIISVHGPHHETLVDAYGENNAVVRTIADLEGAEVVLPQPENPDLPPEPGEGAIKQVGKETGTWETFNGLIPGDADFGRSAFYMPLCFEVLGLQNPINEEKVLSDALVIIMHAAEEIELRWFQQGWFKIVMVIIVAAIIYFSMGRLFKEGMTLIETLTELAIQLGLSFIVDLLVKQVGGEIGLILATVVAAYAVSRGDFTKAQALMPQAKEILIATHSIAATAKAKIKNDSIELKDDIEFFDKTVKERKDEIHEIASMLGDPVAEIDLLDIISENKNSFNTMSSPAAWMDQVKGMKNAAGIVKENVSMYHSRMKELPRVARNDEFATV